ncbi:MAG: MinD/ParA family protein [Thermodesulfobacteriota bacterium]
MSAQTRVVAVASGKGGVGKTTVSVNLALALGRAGHRVCLLDADLGLSNADILLGVLPQHTLEDVLFGGLPMEHAAMPVAGNVDLVAGNSGVLRLAELTRDKRLSLNRQFRKLSSYDYILVDNSPGIASSVLSLCLAARELVVVVTPDPTSITDAYALIKVLREAGLWWSPLVLVNRARSAGQARLVFERIRATAGRRLSLNCAFMGCIPEDPAVAAALVERRPLLERAPSPAARAFPILARCLHQRFACSAARRVSPETFFDRSFMHLKGRAELEAAASSRAAAEYGFADLARDLERVAGLAERLESADGQARSLALRTLRRELAFLRSRIGGKAPAPGAPMGEPAAVPAAPRAPRPAETVLVCCDNPGLREVLDDVVRECGLTPARPLPAHPEAAPDFTGHALGLVCPDKACSDLSGLLRKANGTPILLLSGRTDHRPATLPPCVAQILEKPFRIPDLVTAIRRLAA